MEVYEIKSVDCREKENRKKILTETMKVLKLSERPPRDLLETYCRKLSNRYKTPVTSVRQFGNTLQVNMLWDGAYTVYYCHSYYEALCKHILMMKAFSVYKKMKVK